MLLSKEPAMSPSLPKTSSIFQLWQPNLSESLQSYKGSFGVPHFGDASFQGLTVKSPWGADNITTRL